MDERAEAEKAEAEKEKKVENDDPETLRKAREWDEYTDGKGGREGGQAGWWVGGKQAGREGGREHKTKDDLSILLVVLLYCCSTDISNFK